MTDFTARSRISLQMPQTGKKERTMEKKQASAKQKMASRRLRAEPFRRLDDSALQAVNGGARVTVPTGFADDTTPIYDDSTG